ncbi:heat shock protein 70 family [Umbelopsis sp. AD052]|nr:heat shock protein 70 family [Umbelopsis sp. AD052]
MSEQANVIGINFGTSYSSISYMSKDGRTDCIANEDGDRQIASVLAFSGEEESVGSQAQAQIPRNPNSTVAHFRAQLGKSFGGADELTGAACPIVDKDGKVGYNVALGDEKTQTFTAKEITAKYLRHLRESAEAFLGNPITGAIVSVPSYFTDEQRDELKEAAADAGVKVIQMIHESAAAALAYGIGHNSSTKDPQDKTVVVCDMGAHSFDVTVLNVRTGVYSILATAHDTKLGGASFDENLLNHFAAEFKKKNKIDISGNKKALAKLRAACEVTKKSLSSANSAPCFVESLADGLDFHTNINRLRFEMLSKVVFNDALKVIEEVLKKSDLDASEVDEVIMVGGSARIPKLASKFREAFTNENTKIRSELEPDEVVATGCAIQGSLIAEFDQETIESCVHPVVTLTPHTTKHIGTLNANGEFITIVPRYTSLPTRRIFEFGNAQQGQTQAYFALYEGDHEIVTEEIAAPPREAADDDEEAYEDEPEIVKKVVIKPSTKLLEAVLALENGMEKGVSKIEATLTIENNNKINLVLREKKGSAVVKVQQ